jgi:hypothetical protein
MKKLSGSRTPPPIVERSGTQYQSCPDWVPDAVDRCAASGLVPRPREIVWHLRQTSTRWGTCWPQEGRIHIYPWAGQREEVDDDFQIDSSGEISAGRIGARIVPGVQLLADLEDTLAHELAHLVFRDHGPLHTALTAKLVAVVRRR